MGFFKINAHGKIRLTEAIYQFSHSLQMQRKVDLLLINSTGSGEKLRGDFAVELSWLQAQETSRLDFSNDFPHNLI